jgi:glutamate receptor, ionotropic, invertebrate
LSFQNGALGIIGPTSTESAIHVRNVCDSKEIPLIETRIDVCPSTHVINLHPIPDDLARAYLDLINAWSWQGFTILYEDAPWLPVIDVIMRNYTDKFTVAVRELDVTANGNYRPILSQVKQSEDKNIVICCSIERLEEVLKQAQQVGLLSDQHNILITNLDMHTIDLEPYQHGGTNITGLRMIQPDDSNVREIVESLDAFLDRESMGQEQYGSRYESSNYDDMEVPWRKGLNAKHMRLSTALTYDAGL